MCQMFSNSVVLTGYVVAAAIIMVICLVRLTVIGVKGIVHAVRETGRVGFAVWGERIKDAVRDTLKKVAFGLGVLVGAVVILGLLFLVVNLLGRLACSAGFLIQ